MKIAYNLPNGYNSEITQARENSDLSGWIDRKYGARIRELISNDFKFDISENSFVVDFVHDDDGLQFLKLFGGREI